MDSNVANFEIDAQSIVDLKGGGVCACNAVARIFTLLQPRVLAYLRRRGVDAETADDLCQDLFVRIMEKVGGEINERARRRKT